MNKQDTLLELSASRDIFKNLFNIAYGTKDAILPLKRIMHWQTVREHLSVKSPDLDDSQTLVLGGYFYNFSTPALSESELDVALRTGDDSAISQFLVPTARSDIPEEPFLSRDFVKLPWFVESIFDLESDVNGDLQRRVGGRRSRELLSNATKTNISYETDWLDATALSRKPDLLRQIADLHTQNIEKYHHTVNLYPYDVLAALLQSPLAKNLVICCRRDNSSQSLVQIAICMRDDTRKHLYVLVQGKDYSHDCSGINLYNALFYEFYCYAARNELKTIYLGRGNHDLKRRLGANRFRILNNWILTKTPEARHQLDTLVAEARTALRLVETDGGRDGA